MKIIIETGGTAQPHYHELTPEEVQNYLDDGEFEFYYGQLITGGPWDENDNPISVDDLQAFAQS